jgi:hypothetical protein
LERPLDKHLDNKELDALVPWAGETGQETGELSPAAVREAQQHADSCAACGKRVVKYQQLVNSRSIAVLSETAPPGTYCPNLNDDEWREMAAGLWPESKATQLIAHAALCEHCGPLLRRAVSVNASGEAAVRVQKHRGQAVPATRWALALPSHWVLTRLVAPVALVLIVGLLVAMPRSSRTPFSGAKFAEFAVDTHRQHAQGKLSLALRTGSEPDVNTWLKAKAPFSIALPASPIEMGEERPYVLEGAQLVRVGGKAAAYIAYQVRIPTLQTAATSLIVAPDSVAVASGGIKVDFKKVSFHYATVQGYKVVTWTVHGLTYALVSEEGNSTQRSCMVCHSAMKDRDLSKTPAPSRLEANTPRPLWQ